MPLTLLSRRNFVALSASAAGAFTVGCVNPAYHAGVVARLHRKGDYEGALKRARKYEGHYSTFPLKKKIVYAVYRGASHLKLKQDDEAKLWLLRGKELTQTSPELVDGETKSVLGSGLEALGLASPQSTESGEAERPESANAEEPGQAAETSGPEEGAPPENPDGKWETAE